MQSDAAVFRTQESLAEGVTKIDNVVDSFKDIGIKDVRRFTRWRG